MISASSGKAVQETGFFSRLSGVVPRMGKSDEVAAAAFALSEKDPVSDRVFEVNQKFYVFRLKDRRIPAREEMLAKKESLLEEYRKSKEAEVYRDWLSGLRERSHVKVKAL
jgi:peptidyl-prolyl cis-trans isomerase D